MQYAPPIDRPLPSAHVVYSAKRGGNDSLWEKLLEADRFDVGRRYISGELTIGRTSYPLRSTVVGSFYPGRAGQDGEFMVREFGPAFTGRGPNLNAAFLDWRDLVHRRFQELYAKRPFEQSEEDKRTWRVLESQIDVASYRNNTPLVVKQVGKVGTRMRPHPDRIEWEDGFVERVRLDQMPGEFAGFRPGQPFEAIVERDPIDNRLLGITYIRRIAPLPNLTRQQLEEFISSIPTTESLEPADWD